MDPEWFIPCRSGYKFWEFRIRTRILPMLRVFQNIWNFFFKHLIINQKEEYTYYLSFYISHFSPIQYYTPESNCLQLEIIFFIYLLSLGRIGEKVQDPIRSGSKALLPTTGQNKKNIRNTIKKITKKPVMYRTSYVL